MNSKTKISSYLRQSSHKENTKIGIKNETFWKKGVEKDLACSLKEVTPYIMGFILYTDMTFLRLKTEVNQIFFQECTYDVVSITLSLALNPFNYFKNVLCVYSDFIHTLNWKQEADTIFFELYHWKCFITGLHQNTS